VSLSLLGSQELLYESSAFSRRVVTLFPPLRHASIIAAWVRDVLQKVVDLDSPAKWARLINERAKVFEKHMPKAFNNLTVAQHRDMLWYMKTKSRTFAPKLQRLVAGDFDYLKRQKANSLDPSVGRLILRVKPVGSGGRLVMGERDKKTVRDHVHYCAPCHLPNLNVWQNPRLAHRDVDHNYQVRRQITSGSTMLLCDGCDEGWDRACLDLPWHSWRHP
jgi:hypothetical protein